MFSVPTPLPDDPTALQLILRAAVAEIERLNEMIAGLQRHRFGRKSERLSTDERDRLDQELDDVSQRLAEQTVALTAALPPEPVAEPAPPKRNRGALPAHLPRVEVTIEPDETACPCCGGSLHVIGEDRAELLDHVPSRLRVRLIRRPKLGCRACEGVVLQAPAPERPIDGGMATEALMAHVAISKYCDHQPLYRQTQILARQGIELDRSTLCAWVGRACWWLTPLYELMLSTVLASPVLFADDTSLPVLDPGRGRTKTGRLWCYAVDPGPWKGPGHPAVAYAYSEDRKADHPEAHLKGFRGLLQTDGYKGFNRGGEVTHALCWAHARRKFHDIVANSKVPVPLADEAMRRIGELYTVEARIAGRPADERLALRREYSRPLTDTIHAWILDRLGRVAGGSNIAKAFRYVLSHWDGLTVFLNDGRCAIDTNTVERQMRPVALGKKNAMFAGSDSGGRHWAILSTLIQTAKLNGVEPQAWLSDVLERIVSGRTKRHQLDTFLPWNWDNAEQAKSISAG